MGVLSTLGIAQQGLAQVHLARGEGGGKRGDAGHALPYTLDPIQRYFTFPLPGLTPGRPCPPLNSAPGHVTF